MKLDQILRRNASNRVGFAVDRTHIPARRVHVRGKPKECNSELILERECMEVDVVIVGAGPAGLSAP